MNYKVKTNYEQMTLGITVDCQFEVKVRIKVFDAQKPKTVFTNRYKTCKGVTKFFVRMPLTPEQIIISIYDDNDGNINNTKDKNIRVVNIKKLGLEKRMDEVDINSYSVMTFVDFAQKFSFNASYLKPSTYVSDALNYRIEYLPKIVGDNGKVVPTPARISKSNGRIQVSKQMFDTYTVPMRMAILLHEFAHFYLNENIDDEIEADLNGLLIYLGLGYPRIEGYQAFLDVFQTNPSQANKNRYDVINNFIRDFDNKKFVMF